MRRTNRLHLLQIGREFVLWFVRRRAGRQLISHLHGWTGARSQRLLESANRPTAAECPFALFHLFRRSTRIIYAPSTVLTVTCAFRLTAGRMIVFSSEVDVSLCSNRIPRSNRLFSAVVCGLWVEYRRALIECGSKYADSIESLIDGLSPLVSTPNERWDLVNGGLPYTPSGRVFSGGCRHKRRPAPFLCCGSDNEWTADRQKRLFSLGKRITIAGRQIRKVV